MALLNNTTFSLKFLRGLASKLTLNENNYHEVSEPYYATDSQQFYIHDGTSFKHQGLKRTSTSADPTTTEYPNDKDAGIHKNTTSSNVFLSYNDGGTIKKVQLT